jgi:hypothetical protein
MMHLSRLPDKHYILLRVVEFESWAPLFINKFNLYKAFKLNVHIFDVIT